MGITSRFLYAAKWWKVCLGRPSRHEAEDDLDSKNDGYGVPYLDEIKKNLPCFIYKHVVCKFHQSGCVKVIIIYKEEKIASFKFFSNFFFGGGRGMTKDMAFSTISLCLVWPIITVPYPSNIDGGRTPDLGYAYIAVLSSLMALCWRIYCYLQVAIKVIDTRKIKEDYVKQNLHREARILGQLRHPNIIRLFETLKVSSPHTIFIWGPNIPSQTPPPPSPGIPQDWSIMSYYEAKVRNPFPKPAPCCQEFIISIILVILSTGISRPCFYQFWVNQNIPGFWCVYPDIFILIYLCS